eukprot:3429676-Pleurochrysis_carterae.AAC.1
MGNAHTMMDEHAIAPRSFLESASAEADANLPHSDCERRSTHRLLQRRRAPQLPGLSSGSYNRTRYRSQNRLSITSRVQEERRTPPLRPCRPAQPKP